MNMRWSSEQLRALLRRRYEAGLRLGNGRTCRYPDGMDLELRTLLDQVRLLQLRVRITLRRSHTHEPLVKVLDGHLRRVPRNSHRLGCREGDLGLYESPFQQRGLRHSLDRDVMMMIAKIECIDDEVISGSTAIVIWSHAMQDTTGGAERSAHVPATKKLFLRLHVAAIILLVVGLGIPTFAIASAQTPLHTALSLAGWWIASVAAGSTLGFWSD